MRLRLSRAHYPVTALGYGTRIGIWFQGCTLACRGCISADTWESSPEHDIALDDLLEWCRIAVDGPLDGVTFTGGEPFEQPEALSHLALAFRGWAELDLLCYSGFPLRRLRRDHPDLLGLLDAVIPEPYIGARPEGAIWRGSDNQPLVPLTPLGAQRYGPYRDLRPARRPIQVQVRDEAIWYIGVPGRGDLERLEAAAAAAGITMAGRSWTS